MCEHVKSCRNCEYKDCEINLEPCNECFRNAFKKDRLKFECAICKKEKATRQSDLIKGKK